MKRTWEGIRELIGRQRKYRKSISAVRANSSSPLVNDPSKTAIIMNFHFASCNHHLAAKLPHSEKHFSDHLTLQNDAGFFVFRTYLTWGDCNWDPHIVIQQILWFVFMSNLSSKMFTKNPRRTFSYHLSYLYWIRNLSHKAQNCKSNSYLQSRWCDCPKQL